MRTTGGGGLGARVRVMAVGRRRAIRGALVFGRDDTRGDDSLALPFNSACMPAMYAIALRSVSTYSTPRATVTLTLPC